MSSNTKPLKVGPFKLGMNNRRPETDLQTREGDFLRSAVNVDIDEAGRVSRRLGTTRKITGTDCHSLWSDITRTLTYYVDGTSMYRILNGAAVLVRTGLTPGRRVSYDYGNNATYWSNGIDSGRIVGSTNGAWTLPIPGSFIATGALLAGSLVAGTYRFYVVFVAADGQESAGSDVQSATLAASATTLGTAGTRNDDKNGGAIALTNLPTALPTGAAGVTLYMTGPGSEIFRRAGGVGLTGSFTVSTQPAPDLTGRTLGMAPMPVGSIARIYNARTLTASDSTLFYSLPYAAGLYDPEKNFIGFPAPISLVMPVLNGVYVCADVTYFFKGELADADMNAILPFGGVPGTDVQAIDESTVYWMSARGLVLGDEDGNVKTMQEPNVAIDPPLVGASLMRLQDGVSQLISSGFGVETSGIAAKTYMDAEVIRRAVTLPA